MDPPQETPSPGCWDRGLGSQFPTGYEVGRECILSHESEFTATGIWQLTSRPSYEGFGRRPFAQRCRKARLWPAFETLPGNRVTEGRRCGERDLWGFEDRELSVSSARKEDRASFCRIGRSKGASLAAGGIRFWMPTAIVRGAQSIIEQSPSALASGQWREQAAVRHDGRGDLDHDVSNLIWRTSSRGAQQELSLVEIGCPVVYQVRSIDRANPGHKVIPSVRSVGRLVGTIRYRLDANGARWPVTVNRVCAIQIIVADSNVIKDARQQNHIALSGTARGKAISSIFPCGPLVINVMRVSFPCPVHLLVDQSLNPGHDRRRK